MNIGVYNGIGCQYDGEELAKIFRYAINNDVFHGGAYGIGVNVIEFWSHAWDSLAAQRSSRYLGAAIFDQVHHRHLGYLIPPGVAYGTIQRAYEELELRALTGRRTLAMSQS